MERIEMNTESLQKHFQKEYADFFSRNDLVLSGCFVLPWVREAGNDSNNFFRFKTTLPLKCYVGLKIRNDSNIVFNGVSFFNINLKTFERIEYSKINREYEQVIGIIKKEINKFGVNKGLDIDILSETERGHGLGFSGVSSALISYGIYKTFDKNIYNDFLNENFKNIFSLSGKMDFVSRYGDTFGHNSIFTLKPNKGVSCFLTDKVDITIDTIDEIDDLYYKFYKVDNNNDIDLPFDYYLFFSGLATDTKQIENYKKLEYVDCNLYDFVNKKIFDSEKDIYLNNFNNKDYIQDIKWNMISLQNLNLLNLFYKIYEKPHDSSLINDFIEQINTCRKSVSFLEKENSFAEDLIYMFKKNKLNYSELVGTCPVYSGNFGGGYVVVTKKGLSRETINKTLNDLKNIYPNVEMEYCSYLDGVCEDPICVEQFISNGIYSKYLDKNKVLYKDNKGNNYLGDYSEIILKETTGLLFDKLSNKIYLNGVKLTSKDIHSQNTTIEIISKLLDNIGEEISNKELPSSSYSSNKNDMLGKIVLPFIKIIEEKTGEKISLVCKGGITDFYLKIGTINLKIGFIDKVQ